MIRSDMSLPAQPVSDEAVPAAGALRAVAAVSALGAFAVFALGGTRAPVMPASVALCVIAATSFWLSVRWTGRDTPAERVLRAVGLFVIGGCASVASWFFGPHTEFGALLSLALMLLGAASSPGTERFAWLPSWAGCVALVFGQAAVALMLGHGVLPDEGLVPVVLPGHSRIAVDLALLAFVGWNLFGFIAARRFRDRYHRLAMEVDEATRAAAIRDALLEEARHEYMRALEAGRGSNEHEPREARALDLDHDPDGPTQPLGPGRETTSDAPERTSSPSLADTVERPFPASSQAQAAGARAPAEPEDARWTLAYQQKLGLQQAFVVLGALVGAFSTWALVLDPVARACASAGLLLAAGMALLHRWLVSRRDARDEPHWPWVVVAGAAALVAAGFGIHGVLTSFIVVIVFLGGVFRGRDAARGFNRRSAVIVVLCGSYFVLFLLLWFELLPDRGVLPMRTPNMRWYGPIVHHALMQASFLGAFFLSGSIDRRYRRLRDQVVGAAEEAAAQEALLADASAKLAQIQEEMSAGLFAGERVGRFTLTRRRASGGMGDVYDAVDDQRPEDEHARAAVKLVRVDVVSDPKVLALFAQEVAALQRVESPYVARVLDAGGLSTGLPYVAMELIEGPSLTDILRDARRLDAEQVRELARDVLRGLSALHRSHVVHRDIKPRNLLKATSAPGAPWKIVDLGVAHVGGAPLSRDRFAVVGTPRYMAPEQFKQGPVPVDGRADLYAFSLVLYRALTGRPAFGREPRAQGGVFASPPDPARLVAMHPDVARVLRLGCASDPADRFASAEAFLHALETALDGNLSPFERARATALLASEPWASPRES